MQLTLLVFLRSFILCHPFIANGVVGMVTSHYGLLASFILLINKVNQ